MKPAGAVDAPLSRAWSYILALAVGVLLAEVLVEPNRRLIIFLIGVAVTATLYAVPSVVSLAVLALVLPFGVKIVIGNTNMIFILLLAVVFWLRQVRTPGRLDSGSRVWVPMLLLLFAHAASMYNVPESEFSLALTKVFGLASAMLLAYLMVAMVRDLATLKLILFASIVACALTCVVGFWEFRHPGHAILTRFFYAPYSSRMSGVRAVGTFGNYSNFAQYLAMNLVILAYLFQRATSGLTRMLLLAVMAAAGAIFLSSGMRGAFGALVVAGLYILVFGRHALRISEFATLGIMLSGIMAGAALFLTQVVHTGTIFTRFKLLGATGGTAEARLAIAQNLWSRIHEHVVIGHGPAIRLPESSRVVLSTNNPHNQYLYYLYTVGVLGLVCFLFFAGRIFWEGHRTLVRTRNADSFALGLLAVLQGNLVLFLFHEMFDDYMFSPLSMQVTWFYFGLLLATIRLVQKSAAAPVPDLAPRARAAAGVPVATAS